MLLDQGGEAPPPPTRTIPSTTPLPPPAPPAQDTDVRVVPLDPPVPPPAEAPKPAKIAAPAPPVEKAPAKVAAKPAASPPPAKAEFAVQLGSFSKSSNALGLRDKLKAKGYKAFVKASGSVTRVYVGPQKNRAEAEKALKKLLAETKMKGIVVSFSG
jgi:DedD protein